MQTRNRGVEKLEETIQKLRNQLAESQDNLVKSLRAQEEISSMPRDTLTRICLIYVYQIAKSHLWKK